MLDPSARISTSWASPLEPILKWLPRRLIGGENFRSLLTAWSLRAALPAQRRYWEMKMKEHKSRIRTLFLISVLLIICAPAMAQYRDNLGGNWNNPASATITNIILDRYARRRLEKRLGVKRANAGATAESRSPAASETAAKVNDVSVRFRSTGTQLKTREIANLIDAKDPRVFAILTAILNEYEKGSRESGKGNDLALALSFFLATNASVYHDAGPPPDSPVMELRDTIASALVEGNALNGVTDRQKQEMYETLVLYTGLALAGYQEAKQGGDTASLNSYRQLAGMNLQAVTGISPDKITFTDQGLNIEREPAEASTSVAAESMSTALAAGESSNSGVIDYNVIAHAYEDNEVGAEATYGGRRIQVSGRVGAVRIEKGRIQVQFVTPMARQIV